MERVQSFTCICIVAMALGLEANCSALGLNDDSDDESRADAIALIALFSSAGSSAGISSASITNSAIQSIPSGSFTNLTFDTEIFDTGNYFDPNNPSKLIIPADGVYLITATVEFTSNPAGDRAILTNGSWVRVWVPAATAGATYISGSSLDTIRAGIEVYLQAFQSSGGPLNIGDTSNRSPRLSIVRVQ